jgi:hypothetical protein
MRTITIPALALITSLASGALLLAATEGAIAKNRSSHNGASELREVPRDHGHDGKHDHDHNSKHKDHNNKGKGKEKADNKCGGKKKCERARRPQVDVNQAPYQTAFVPADRHCPLVVRQQTRGVCDAASVLHGPSGSPGTKKSQTCVVTDLRRLSFADCDSRRSHNYQGKI